MESVKSWKSYIVDNYKFLTGEVWQIGSDAKTEAANIFNDISKNTSEIYNDLATTDYKKVTQADRNTKVEKFRDETQNAQESSSNDKMKVFRSMLIRKKQLSIKKKKSLKCKSVCFKWRRLFFAFSRFMFIVI